MARAYQTSSCHYWRWSFGSSWETILVSDFPCNKTPISRGKVRCLLHASNRKASVDPSAVD